MVSFVSSFFLGITLTSSNTANIKVQSRSLQNVTPGTVLVCRYPRELDPNDLVAYANTLLTQGFSERECDKNKYLLRSKVDLQLFTFLQNILSGKDYDCLKFYLSN